MTTNATGEKISKDKEQKTDASVENDRTGSCTRDRITKRSEH